MELAKWLETATETVYVPQQTELEMNSIGFLSRSDFFLCREALIFFLHFFVLLDLN